jgi:hypothetical protein
MGEAGVHRNIEMTAWGVNEIKLLQSANFDKLSSDLSLDQRLAYETYAGNWMRDFSQLFVPIVYNTVKDFKKEAGVSGAPLGGKNATTLLTALLKAFAILELGDQVGQNLVTAKNLGAYKPEEHMDNPGGYTLKNDVLVRTGDEFVTGDVAPDGERKSQLGGSGITDKLQLEEAKLYQLGPNRLGLHIFNTTEWVKKSFKDSLSAGSDSERRMLFGRGLHGIEDYFAHSNYIEVVLNLIMMNPNKFGLAANSTLRGKPSSPNTINSKFPVDTLFEISGLPPSSPSGGGSATLLIGSLDRQAITTGTFGSLDTKISIIHVLIPIVGPLFEAINKSIDEWLTIIENNEESTIDKIIAKSKLRRSSLAIKTILQGMDDAGITFPILTIETKKIRDLIESDLVKMVIPDSLLDVKVPVDIPRVKQTKSKEAFDQYLQIFKVIKVLVKFRDAIKDLLKLDIIKGVLRAALTQALDIIDTLLKKFREFLKFQIRKLIIRLIVSMLGLDLSKITSDKEAALDKLAENTQELIKRMVEEADFLVPSTSLQTRTTKGDLSKTDPKDPKSPRKNDPNVVPGVKDPKELPPSHSEVCKDHPPSHESIFFELHRELAIEAVRHLTVLMHDAWKSAGFSTKVISGQASGPSSNSVESLDKEAKERADAAKTNMENISKKHGVQTAFLQSGGAADSLKKLANAVDLYISHPLDTVWWQSVVKKYLASSSKETKVMSEAAERNKTRTRRQ